MSMAGVPSAMLFVRSDAGGISHAPEEYTEADAVGWCVRHSHPRSRSWRPDDRLGGAGPAVAAGPGGVLAGPDARRAEGPARPRGVEPLNWNEDMFGAARRRAGGGGRGAVTGVLLSGALLRRLPRRGRRVGRRPTESVIPAHGGQALIGALTSAFIDPGTQVVIPKLTYGLYAQVSAAGGAVVTRVDRRGWASTWRPSPMPSGRPTRAWCGCVIPTTPPAR